MSVQQLNLDGMGRLSAAVLEQDVWWRDGRGLTRRLEELDHSHLERLIPFLRRHGEKLRWLWLEVKHRQHCAVGRDVIGAWKDENGKEHPAYGRLVPLFSDNGGNLDNGFEEWTDYEMDRPFDEWLEDRPLIKRIRQLLEAP